LPGCAGLVGHCPEKKPFLGGAEMAAACWARASLSWVRDPSSIVFAIVAVAIVIEKRSASRVNSASGVQLVK